MGFLRQYLLAVQTFTRVPVTGSLAQWVGADPPPARGSAAHFPGVGWLVGIVACSVFAFVGLALQDGPFAPLAAGVACIIATSILTGAVHETGLARTVERFGGFGALATVLSVLAKVSLLALLDAHSPVAVLVALLAAHVVSRFWPLWLGRTLGYLGEGAADKPLAAPLDRRSLAIAGAWSAVALAIAAVAQSPAFAIAALVASGLGFFAMQQWLARRQQGFDDDGLGATQQVCEAAFYLGAAVGLGIR